MPRSSKPPSWGQLKQRLARIGAAELLKILHDLHELSAENRSFLQARFLPRNDDIERYRQQVAEAIYPDVFSRQPISIAAAKRAIRQYERATEDPVGTLDLRLTFVERGTAQAVDLGYGDDSYFASLESMLGSTLQVFRRLPGNAREPFLSRLVRLRSSGSELGWGYGDFLADALADVEDG